MQYQNPVYTGNFPDPSILKHAGIYWAYATGRWPDGRCFGILRSTDLVHWEAIGGAMEPLAEDWPHYWAPEVIYQNGRFYLYYSTGDELNTMHIRVAIADNPAGPFIDSGRILTSEPFAIDAHVFTDRDGSQHLFYATDYLEHSHIGTGTARDQLLDYATTAGHPLPVTRARYDWQVYDPQRAEKGGVRWHTIEGPYVLLHKNRYYQMFSGGNWQNPSYGVSYAIADQIDQQAEWEQSADGQQTLPILRTIPGHVIGPGHNSVVRGPDNRQLICVYHRWDLAADARVLAIDKLDWVGERLIVLGPSTTPQLLHRPTFSDYFGQQQAHDLGANWQCQGGSWQINNGALQIDTTARAAAQLIGAQYTAESCLIELTMRVLDDPTGHGSLGVAFGDQFSFLIEPGQNQAVVMLQHVAHAVLTLPAGFEPAVDHLLRIEGNAKHLLITLDGGPTRWAGRVDLAHSGALTLHTNQIAACFAGIELTAGWEDLFTEQDVTLSELGWSIPAEPASGNHTRWQLQGNLLTGTGEHALIFKGPLPPAYELVVNARLISSWGASYTLLPAAQADNPGPMIVLEESEQHWILRCSAAGHVQIIALPATFDPHIYQQWRLICVAGQVTIYWENLLIGKFPITTAATQIGLLVERATVAFDMVRVTAMASNE